MTRTNHKRLQQQLKAMQEGLIKRPDFSDNISLPEFLCKVQIIDERGDLVDFIMYEEQEYLLDLILKARAEGRIPRFIVYKPRRIGVSTLIEGIIYGRSVLEPPCFSAIVAHDWDTVRGSLFPMIRVFNEHLPEEYRRPLKYETQAAFEWEAPYHSRIVLGTANNQQLFRGYMALLVHFSEFAWYENPQLPLTAATATCPKNSDSLMVIESTPNGDNLFKQVWDAAENGDNDYTPVFFSCKDRKKYFLPLAPNEKLNLTEEWLDYQKQYDLTLENTKFLHYVWLNDYHSDWDSFNQEYPITPEIGFVSSGTPYFNQHILAEWGKTTIHDPIFRGDIQEDEPRIIQPMG